MYLGQNVTQPMHSVFELNYGFKKYRLNFFKPQFCELLMPITQRILAVCKKINMQFSLFLSKGLGKGLFNFVYPDLNLRNLTAALTETVSSQ